MHTHICILLLHNCLILCTHIPTLLLVYYDCLKIDTLSRCAERWPKTSKHLQRLVLWSKATLLGIPYQSVTVSCSHSMLVSQFDHMNQRSSCTPHSLQKQDRLYFHNKLFLPVNPMASTTRTNLVSVDFWNPFCWLELLRSSVQFDWLGHNYGQF